MGDLNIYKMAVCCSNAVINWEFRKLFGYWHGE